MKSTVSLELIYLLSSYAQSQGVDLADAFSGTALDSTLFDDVENRVEMESFIQVWQSICCQCNDPDFGLKLGTHMAKQFPKGHVLSTLMLNCPDLESALIKFLEYSELLNSMFKFEYHQSELSLTVEITGLIPGIEDDQQGIECAFSFIVQMMNQLTRQTCLPTTVSCRFPRLGRSQDLEWHQSVRLHTRQPVNSLTFERKQLQRAIPLANAHLLETLESYADLRLQRITSNQNLCEESRSWIFKELSNSRNPTLERLANHFAMSGRSLQLKLKSKGCKYMDLLADARRSIAMDLLQDNAKSLNEISYTLGFSEQSSFTHAFKRWTGRTPTQFRNDLKQSAIISFS